MGISSIFNAARRSSYAKSSYKTAGGFGSKGAAPQSKGGVFGTRGGVSVNPGQAGLGASLRGLGGRLFTSVHSGLGSLGNLGSRLFNPGLQGHHKPQSAGNWASQFTGHSYAVPGKQHYTPRPNPHGDGGWASQFTRPQANPYSSAGKPHGAKPQGAQQGPQSGPKPQTQGAHQGQQSGPKPQAQGAHQGQQSGGSRPYNFMTEQANKRKDALNTLGMGHLNLESISPADKAALRKSYLQWSKKNHPDKGGDTAMFQSVSGALGDYIK